MLGEFRFDEGIDWIATFDFRLPTSDLQRLQRPPLLPALQHGLPIGILGHLLGTGWGVAGIDGSIVNPLLEGRDDVRIQLGSILGHGEVFVLVANGLDEQALCRIARHDGRSAVASGLPAWARVEQQAAFGFRGLAVAFVAVLREHGTDLRFEELDLIRRGGER